MTRCIPALNYKKAKEGRRKDGKQVQRQGGGGSAGGPVAELSLPRFAILTAVGVSDPRPVGLRDDD